MTGTVTLSMEIELGWGYHDLSREDRYAKFSPRRRAETEYLEAVLELCEELDVEISFNIVGHLLLDSCSGNHPGPHSGDWFGNDPGTDVDNDPLFYAPDLVRRISQSDVDHELLTHSFSHVLFDEISDEVAEWELRRCCELHRKMGIDEPRTLVPPRHREPSLAVLRSEGIECVRVPFEGYSGPDTRPEKFVWVLRRKHPVGEPDIHDGVLRTYCTPHPSLTAGHLPEGQSKPHPAFRLIPLRVRQWIQQRYLKNAFRRVARVEGHGHFWTHLHDLSNPAQWAPFEAALRSLADRRDEGSLIVRKMEDLRDYA